MGFNANEPTTTRNPCDVVFIGSCTNGRLSDLRAAAEVLARPQGRGRRAHAGGARLGGRETRCRSRRSRPRLQRQPVPNGVMPGCSMCIAMNGDVVPPGKLAVSTSNRNFEGRQGKGARTILASPATAAASAIAGVLTDPRAFTREARQMPEQFKQLTSRTFVLPQANIDTDQIIPARFLTTTTRDRPGRQSLLRLALRF